MIKLTACAALALLIAVPAYAASTSADGPADYGIPGFQTTSSTPWLTTDTHSDTFMGLGGLVTGTTNQASVRLGDGLSVGITSSFYNGPNSVIAYSATSAGPGLAIDPISGLYTGPHAGLAMGPGDRFYPNGPAASSFGGNVAMDLGNGVSVNFVGGVTRMPGNGFALGAPGGVYNGGLYMSPSSSTLSGNVGAGVSLDLGGGSSLSISGAMSKGAASCGGLAFGFCR